MLNAIVQGKVQAPFTTLPEGRHWREAYGGTEDFLTATVFERLSYLPEDLFYRILRRATIPSGWLPPGKYALEEIEFWPRWDIREERRLGDFKEPDLLLFFRSVEDSRTVRVVVEAKKPGGVQYPEQWATEWIALKDQEDIQEGDVTFLLGVDGYAGLLEPSRRDLEKRANVHLVKHAEEASLKGLACTWYDLLKASIEEILSFEDGPYSPASRILSDLVSGFGLHEVRITTWLEDLPAAGKAFMGLRDESVLCLRDWRLR